MIHAVIYDIINNFQDGPGEAFEGGVARLFRLKRTGRTNYSRVITGVTNS